MATVAGMETSQQSIAASMESPPPTAANSRFSPRADDTGPFTRFDGYRSDFVEGLTSEVKVYLNTDWTNGEGFDYSVAATRRGRLASA